MTSKYYSFIKLLSYNAIYNMCVGGRGIGKTFGAKKIAIKDALTDKGQFIYLRRYKTELGPSAQTFFSSIGKFFPDWDFRVMGNQAHAAKVSTRGDNKKRQWYVIGYFVALSQAQNYKSADFPDVLNIIFDEFIIERGTMHYLPDETTILNNFYSTVDRDRDTTRVFFLANSVSIMNPYFIEWNIVPDGREFVTYKKRFVVCHFPDSKEFNNEKYKSRFGQFIKDTEYADYAIENNFSDNTETLLLAKDPKARYIYTIETRTGYFSVWYNFYANKYYIQAPRPKSEEIYTLLSTNMDTDKILVGFSDKPLANMRTAFRQGNMFFDTPTTRNTFTEIFKR